ncbi:dehydratase MaoC metal-binding domain protein, partial [Bordetella holmesii H620]
MDRQHGAHGRYPGPGARGAYCRHAGSGGASRRRAVS